jgi:hypothetical protein
MWHWHITGSQRLLTQVAAASKAALRSEPTARTLDNHIPKDVSAYRDLRCEGIGLV